MNTSKIGAACTILLSFVSALAHAQQMQMLPPTNYGTSTPCNITNGILTYSGSSSNDANGRPISAINCVSGATLNSNGDIGIGLGTASPGAGLDIMNTSYSNYYANAPELNASGQLVSGPEAVVASFRGGATEPDGFARERVIIDGSTTNTSPSIELRASDPSGASRDVALAYIPPGWSDSRNGTFPSDAHGLFSIWMPTLGNAFNIDTTNGNIGIGTPLPQVALDVANGWISPQDNVTTTTNDGTGITWYYPSPTSYGLYRTAGAWLAPNYQQLAISFATGITIDGGKYYGKSGTILQPNGGNVGIGTTATPTASLDVTGTMKVLGTRVSLNLGTVYGPAPTDGFVVVSGRLDGDSGSFKLSVNADSNNPPQLEIANQYSYNNGVTYLGSVFMTVPILKGEFYEILCNEQTACGSGVWVGTPIFYFVPFGHS